MPTLTKPRAGCSTGRPPVLKAACTNTQRRALCHIAMGVLAIACILFVSPVGLGAQPAPEPHPPEFGYSGPEKVPPSYPRVQETPDNEWTYHKTDDNEHPDGNEQQMMWLMNRARANPPAEGVWLATMDDPDVVQDRDGNGWNVDLELLQAEFAAIAAKFPAAFDVRLYNAAREHSEYMISCNCQSHTGQDTRVMNSGFDGSYCRGNIFAWAKTGVHGHAALNVDWGEDNDGSGMQPGRGHRISIMSIDGDFPRNLANVGIAMVQTSGSFPDTVGPLVMTGNYCTARISSWTPDPSHHNRFLVGTVWEDTNSNGLYDPGEGFGSVSVTPDHGEYYAETSNSGGYAIPITEPGTYQVTFSGPTISHDVVKTVTVGDVSLLLDLQFLLPGDVNGDGRLNLADGVLALQVVAGMDPQAVHADYVLSTVRGNGKVTLADGIYVLRLTANH